MSTQNKIYLTSDQRAFLDHLIRSGSSSARKLSHARILLLSERSQGQHLEDAQVAQAMRLCVATVRALRQRFVREGLDACLSDRPRPGRAPKLTGEVEARLVTLVCSNPPGGNARWTLRLLADQMVALDVVDQISHVAIGNALKKTNLSLGVSKRGA